MTIQRFRQTEFWVITSLTVVFLFIFLIKDYTHYIRILGGIGGLEEKRIFFSYNWWLNGCWPFFSISLTAYGCWYALNYIILPRFWPENRLLIIPSIIVLGMILLTGVWSYLFFLKELDFRYDSMSHIIGAKILSAFRLLNVALLGLGTFILLLLYTFLSQLYQWAIQQPESESDIHHKIILDGAGLSLAGFGIIVTLDVIIEGDFMFFLLLWIQGAFIHAYLFHYRLIRWAPKPERRIILQRLLFIIVLSIITSILFVIPGRAFYVFNGLRLRYYYYLFNIEYVFVIGLFSWIGGVGVTVIRQFLVKPLEVNLSRNVAELSALRAQINPHFLFNAMNTLYATAIEENAEKTSHGIQQLSDMMRFMMHENNQEQIDVQQEVTYLRNYIDLQRLRLSDSDKLELKVELDDALCLRSIAPMLLVPFVENAFKHGISLRNQSWIYIKLYCQQDNLHFSVYNSIHPRNEEDPEKYSSGIGLVNVQKRLELLYPKNHQLQLHRTEKEFSVDLVLNFSVKKSRRILSKILPS